MARIRIQRYSFLGLGRWAFPIIPRYANSGFRSRSVLIWNSQWGNDCTIQESPAGKNGNPSAWCFWVLLVSRYRINRHLADDSRDWYVFDWPNQECLRTNRTPCGCENRKNGVLINTTYHQINTGFTVFPLCMSSMACWNSSAYSLVSNRLTKLFEFWPDKILLVCRLGIGPLFATLSSVVCTIILCQGRSKCSGEKYNLRLKESYPLLHLIATISQSVLYQHRSP
jgi:hypothetical protein